MPPKVSNLKHDPDGWWNTAYAFNETICAQFELEFEGDIIRPGNPIKFKNRTSVYKFRCLAHNTNLDITWIDCIDSSGAFCSFPVSKLVGLVKPKRSRRKKLNV